MIGENPIKGPNYYFVTSFSPSCWTKKIEAIRRKCCRLPPTHLPPSGHFSYKLCIPTQCHRWTEGSKASPSPWTLGPHSLFQYQGHWSVSHAVSCTIKFSLSSWPFPSNTKHKPFPDPSLPSSSHTFLCSPLQNGLHFLFPSWTQSFGLLCPSLHQTALI